MISFPSTARERARRSSARPFRIARGEIRNLTEMGRDSRAGSFLLKTFVLDESRRSNTRARERAASSRAKRAAKRLRNATFCRIASFVIHRARKESEREKEIASTHAAISLRPLLRFHLSQLASDPCHLSRLLQWRRAIPAKCQRYLNSSK